MAEDESVGTYVILGSIMSSAFFLLFYYIGIRFFGNSYNLLLFSALSLLTLAHISAYLVGSVTRQGLVLIGLSLVLLLEEILINSQQILYGFLLSLSMTIILPILATISQNLRRCLEIYGILFVSRIIFIPLQPSFLKMTLSQPILYTLIFLSLALYMRFRGISSDHVGLSIGRFSPFLQIPAAISIGFMLGLIEYHILLPVPIRTKERLLESIAYLSIFMFVFVSTTEEIMFRGLLFNFLSDAVPISQSILIVSVQFGLMHLGWGVPLELLFAYIAGIIFSYIFYKTQSLLMPIIIHGVGNLTLYILALLAL
ncbi:MAG: lysostaphin resistance A-like protein [Thermoproteota archaeon]